MKERSKNLLFAALVFICTLLCMILGSTSILLLFITGAKAIFGPEGASAVLHFFDNTNYSGLVIYLMLLFPFGIWYYENLINPRKKEGLPALRTANLKPTGYAECFLLSVWLSLAGTLIIMALSVLMPRAMEQYESLVDATGLTDYSLAWVVSTLILPPLVEEIIFRGLIMDYLKKAGLAFAVANIIQAVAFGLYHMNLIQGIYTMLVGLVLGFVAYKTDTLIASMIIHSLFNLFGTVGVDLMNAYLPDFVILILALFGVPLLAVTLILLNMGVGLRKEGERA